MQLLQALEPNDKPKRREFAVNMMERISEDETILKLWGYVKDIVYRTKIRDITDLKQRIANVIATIDEAILQRTWQEIEFRLDVLHTTNGAYI